MIENKEELDLMSDRVSWSGRTLKARSTPTKAKISRQSSRKSSVSQSQMPLMCLCLIRENGPTQDSCSMRWGGVSVAWRLHDAQYWGVPQRRERVAIVADFGGLSAGEILFESESLQGNPNESGEARKGTSTRAESSTDCTVSVNEDRVISSTVGGYMQASENQVATLMARDFKDPQIIMRA